MNCSKYLDIKLPDDFDDSIGYHRQCYSSYTSIKSQSSTPGAKSPRKRLLRSQIDHTPTSSTDIQPKVCFFCKLHNEAFDKKLQVHVVNTMINDAGTELLTSLHSRYLTHLKVDDSSYPARSLCEKLLKTFPDSLQTTKKSKKAGIIVFNVILSEESAIRKAKFD